MPHHIGNIGDQVVENNRFRKADTVPPHSRHLPEKTWRRLLHRNPIKTVLESTPTLEEGQVEKEGGGTRHLKQSR